MLTATALRLPLLNPYLTKNASTFNNGVNFAVGGSTALDSSFFLAKGIIPPPLPSLSVQLGWFKRYLDSVYSTPTERADKLSKSLVFVGETGYNDIAISIYQGRSVEEAYTYVPSIVEAIINTTREVIKYGATQVVVPGTFPLGCFPWALHALGSNDPTSYDEIGCLKSLNDLNAFLNQQLQEDLDSLRKEFPNVVILYADYYIVFYSLLREASTLGVSVCPNPNIYIHWDGIHPTQEVYRQMSDILIKDLKMNCTQ
ncbi:hypothetical protein ACS0TY_023051 [Phlomoides rotata]